MSVLSQSATSNELCRRSVPNRARADTPLPTRPYRRAPPAREQTASPPMQQRAGRYSPRPHPQNSATSRFCCAPLLAAAAAIVFAAFSLVVVVVCVLARRPCRLLAYLTLLALLELCLPSLLPSSSRGRFEPV